MGRLVREALRRPRALVSRLLPANCRPTNVLVRQMLDRANGRVISGPFQGLRFETLENLPDWPKVLGTYEVELDRLLAEIVGDRLGRIVNVGSAEGYYAVGLAMLCPRAQVTTFEVREFLREKMGVLAALNGVADRITAGAYCDAKALAEAIGDPTSAACLVVMDIEGGEVDLLDPEITPSLLKCEVLVEEHDFERPGATQLLRKRFGATHDVQQIHSRGRSASDLPYEAPVVLRPWVSRLMYEGRPAPQSWLYMRPKRQAE